MCKACHKVKERLSNDLLPHSVARHLQAWLCKAGNEEKTLFHHKHEELWMTQQKKWILFTNLLSLPSQLAASRDVWLKSPGSLIYFFSQRDVAELQANRILLNCQRFSSAILFMMCFHINFHIWLQSLVSSAQIELWKLTFSSLSLFTSIPDRVTNS